MEEKNAIKEKNFIREKIVGRRGDRRKCIRHYLRVSLSALLFGALSAGMFVLIEPLLQDRLHRREPESVELETELPDPETSGSQPETEAETEKQTEPIEEVVQSEIENYSFPMSAYESMFANLKQLAGEAERSLATVTAKTSNTDVFGMEVESADSYSGIILAITGNEVLVLTPLAAVENPEMLELSFQRDTSYPASLKAKDSTDGLAVVSSQVSALSEKDRMRIRAVTLGNSRLLQRGDTLIAVGAPSGTLYSSATGMISSISYNTPATDGTVEIIQADLNSSSRLGSFILNTSGELVGWVSGQGSEQQGYCRIAGISDYLSSLELLSNGAEIPYLGLTLQEISSDMRRRGIPEGIYVRGTAEGSPAYMAGIQSGDIVTAVNETEILAPRDMQKALRMISARTELTVTVLRQRGQEYTELSFQLTAAAR